MCGILGSLGLVNTHLDINGLSHRGPDHSGEWYSKNNEAPASLFHSRLSIIDTSDNAHQPCFSADRRFALVFNGEIYNFIELRQYLRAQGVVFHTESDTEVLLQGLIHYGTDFLQKCNGMWAFCFLDRSNGHAILARDRFGVKPLYYAFIDKSLIFSSEIKALIPALRASGKYKSSNNIKHIYANPFSYEYSDSTFIDSVSKVPAGHVMNYDYGQHIFNIKRWWCTLDYISHNTQSYDDNLDEWKKIFFDAVKLRLRSDVPIACALSGGLDSSSIFSTIKSSFNYSITPFACHFPGSSLDELKYAQSLADFYDSRLSILASNPDKSSWSISSSLYQVEDPYITLPIPMLDLYSLIKHSNFKVSIDGHGADELFSGYGEITSSIRNLGPSALAEIIAIDESTRTGIYSLKQRGKTRQWLLFNLKRKLRHSSYIRKLASILSLSDYENVTPFHEDFTHPRFLEMDIFTQSLYTLFHVTTLPTLLRNYDKYSMASGVEVRMPFLDWRLVVMTFALNPQAKLGNTFTKRILRDSMFQIVPDNIRLRRQKIGWNAPLHEWLSTSYRSEITEMVSDNKALYSKWMRFLSKENASFKDGQAIWSCLMPFLHNKVFFE